MLPGVDLDALPEFGKGQLCSVAVPGNPAPFAVTSRSPPSSLLHCSVPRLKMSTHSSAI